MVVSVRNEVCFPFGDHSNQPRSYRVCMQPLKHKFSRGDSAWDMYVIAALAAPLTCAVEFSHGGGRRFSAHILIFRLNIIYSV